MRELIILIAWLLYIYIYTKLWIVLLTADIAPILQSVGAIYYSLAGIFIFTLLIYIHNKTNDDKDSK